MNSTGCFSLNFHNFRLILQPKFLSSPQPASSLSPSSFRALPDSLLRGSISPLLHVDLVHLAVTLTNFLSLSRQPTSTPGTNQINCELRSNFGSIYFKQLREISAQMVLSFTEPLENAHDHLASQVYRISGFLVVVLKF
ncbi:hypothetical protein ACFX2G_029211 [Malus domestica]